MSGSREFGLFTISHKEETQDEAVLENEPVTFQTPELVKLAAKLLSLPALVSQVHSLCPLFTVAGQEQDVASRDNHLC